MLINAGVPIPVAIALCLLLGLAVGAINAFISVYQRTEPFIITLGMGIVLTGIGQQLTNAHPVSSADPDFQNIANLQVLGPVPILVVVMIAVVAVTYWVLRSTSFGRNVYAVGGDFEVAKYSGINVRRTKAATYLICGVTAAFAGVMLASQLSSASSIAGDTVPLFVVCAVVVGGTSVAGGVGGAIKSTIGLVLLGILTNAFNMLRIDSLVSYLPTALLGIIIVSILWLDSYGRKRKREVRLGQLPIRAGPRTGSWCLLVARASRARQCTSVHLSATRRGYAAGTNPSTVNTTSHRFRPATGEHRTSQRRSRREFVHEIPLLRPSAAPLPLGGAGLS